MKTIVVRTQAELDALPDSFEQFTVIQIRSNSSIQIEVKKSRDSSRVEAWDSSRVVARESSSVEAHGSSSIVAYDSSRVVAWGSSRVEACDSSRVVAYGSSSVVAYGSSRVVAHDSSSVWAYGSNAELTLYMLTFAFIFSRIKIKHLADHSTAKFIGLEPNIDRKDDTATVILAPATSNPSFETWLERGYVVADGIHLNLVSKKRVGNLEVFNCQDFHKKISFVVKRGDTFSHGNTLKEAKDSLKFKISSRDTSEFKTWTLKKIVSQGKMIEAYRVITGACEFGVRDFCKGKRLPAKLSVAKAIELTKGAYGNEKFSEFFK